MSEYLVKVQLPDADYSLAKITAEESICTCDLLILLCFCISIPVSRSELKLDFCCGLLSPNSDFLAMTIKGSQVHLWQQNIKLGLLVLIYLNDVAFNVY